MPKSRDRHGGRAVPASGTSDGERGSASLAADLAQVAPLRALAAAPQGLCELGGDLDGVSAPRAGALICLVGPTGAGKSTLLNALAGQEIAREGVDRPTTDVPVVYAPWDCGEEFLARLPPAQVVRYHAAAVEWAGHVLIDAPDLNSVRESHREIVHRLAAEADVLLIVLHHQALAEDAVCSFLDRFVERRWMAAVLNRTDEMTDATRRELVGELERRMRERWRAEGPVFALSARDARRSPAQQAGFLDLVRWLRHLVDERVVRGIRRDNRLGAARQLGAAYARLARTAAPLLEEIEGQLVAGWQELATLTSEDVARRAAARRADLELLLAAEIAQRWRGPGGWLLRLGVSGPAAALALRRNLLLAGTVAIAAEAAGRLRRGRARTRIEGAAEITPTGTDLVAWSEQALRPARMSLRALAGDARATAETAWLRAGDVPAARLEGLTSAVADCWHAAISRDLSELAVRWWMRWLELPLDLPLYALAAHVGWNSVAHYWAGTYLGTDYYLNAAVLAALLAGVSYAVARAAVAVSARRFVARAIVRLRQVVEERCRAHANAAAAELVVARASLSRLADLGRSQHDVSDTTARSTAGNERARDAAEPLDAGVRH